MIGEILFYLTAFVMLFVSIFWFITFLTAEKKKIMNIKKFPQLTIIVPAYNAESKIRQCIGSLISQKYPGLKIIIVDDGSTDRTGKIARAYAKKHRNIKYLKKKNSGKASALNYGLRHVNTELFGFLDSDTYLSENALKNMVGYFGSDVGAVTASIKPERVENTIERLQKVEYLISSFTRKLMSHINSLYYTPAFAIYKTGVIKELGGFDENNLTEDLEIGLRLKKNGYDIENSIEDCAYTEIPNNFKVLFRQRIRWYRGFIYNTKKYSSMLFSRKHGDLGILVLPMQYIILALIIPFLLYSIYDIGTVVFQKAVDLYLTGFDLSYINATSDIIIISPTTFFVLAFVVSFFIMIKLSKDKIGSNISKLDYIVYLIVYPFINVFMWISALAYEIIGAKKKW
jgi:cellulose synthase/poly-beta-1,6-N-acetylglucosamine synthase-like glycosyltransferase